MHIYEYCSTLLAFLAKSHFLNWLFAFVQYFHELRKRRFLSWIALLYSFINKYKCKLIYILSEKCVEYSIICFPEKIFAFMQLLKEYKYFFDIQLSCLQITLIWWKIVLSIIRIQMLPFWKNATSFIHIFAVSRFTAQIEISYQQMIFIFYMWVLWQV